MTEEEGLPRRSVPECTGACCDPVRIQASNYVLLRLDPGRDADGETLLDMLEGAPGAEDLLTLGVLDQLKRTQGIPGAVRLHLSCRHFDPETRRCGIYERRPEMCRVFPNGDPCEFCGSAGVVLEDEDEPRSRGWIRHRSHCVDADGLARDPIHEYGESCPFWEVAVSP